MAAIKSTSGDPGDVTRLDVRKKGKAQSRKAGSLRHLMVDCDRPRSARSRSVKANQA